MAKEYLDFAQFNWIYQDFKHFCDDEYVYNFQFEYVATNYDTREGYEAVTAVTKTKKVDTGTDESEYLENPENFVDLGDVWADSESEFGAIWRMMNYRASKTNRTRNSFDATLDWLQKLPLNTRVEL